jgi:hypothetical protein
MRNKGVYEEKFLRKDAAKRQQKKIDGKDSRYRRVGRETSIRQREREGGRGRNVVVCEIIRWIQKERDRGL